MKAPSEEEQPGPLTQLKDKNIDVKVSWKQYKPPLVQNMTSSLSGSTLLSKK